ncbi:discoidin domain-containing protein [Cellulosimicrobium cellulans]|nr:glycosyl hydrolase family 28-related protein [Cellulosimicrobium cellulans]
MHAGAGRVVATGAALVMAVTGLVAPAVASPVVDVDRYPVGVGADLSTTPRTHGIAVATAPTTGAQATGEEGGRAFWRTDAAAGAERIALDVADAYVGRLADVPGYLVVDHRAGEQVVATAADGSVLGAGSGAGAPEADADGDGWTSTVVALPAGALGPGTEAGGDPEVSLAATDGELSVASVRVVAQGTSVDLGPTVAERGIAVRAGDATAGLVTGTADGRGYWQTGRAQGTNFVYANVSDAYALDTRDRVLVDATVQQGGGDMFLQYDSPGDTIPHMFKPSPRLALGTDGSWVSRSWLLDDAILTNRSNGSDFRLSVEGSPQDVRIDSLAVTVVPREVDPAIALRRLVERADVTYAAAREGERDGQYPAGSRAGLRAAIDAADAVAQDPDANGDAVDAATTALEDALEDFLASQVTTDLARGKPVTVSSGGPAAAATDGDRGTAWTSARDGDAEWVQVDLGAVTEIDEVLVRWTPDYAHVYRVEVSTDGTTYDEVASAGAIDATGVRTRFEPVDARYVRLALDERATQRAAFALTDLEVRRAPAVPVEPRLVETVFPTEDVVVADQVVTDFGADPTGEADSTAAIQAALYACQDATGGTVWLPAGTYRVTGTLEVLPHCTLRGDHPDRAISPDADPLDGTVVVADLTSGDDGPSLFRVGGNAGVVGVTTYYPGQDAADPVPYGFTVELPGRAWQGEQNYMMSSVEHVTMLNSYRGIGISTMAHDRGEGGPGSQVHEIANVRDVVGTALLEGVVAYNGADVGTWQDVTFDNGVWAGAGAAYDAPERAVLDAWTREHGTGLVLGDLEWDEFSGISVADYAVGIRIVKGQRASFTGSFLDTEVRRTDVAVQVEVSDDRWGTAFAGGSLEGSEAAVRNTSGGYVKLTGTDVSGALEGTVHVLEGPDGGVPARPETVLAPRPAERLVDVTKTPYDVPRTPGRISDVDVTAAIQAALDDTAAAGGGVVYLPAGWYTVRGHLTVPAGVELRGSAGVANRDSLELSGGTVLLAYEGGVAPGAPGEPDPSVDETAFVTLAGEDAGLRGLRVFHPENNPAGPDGVRSYPFAVRGDAPGTYVVDVGLTNAWNAIDLTAAADGFLVRRAVGLFLSEGVHVGANAGGTVENVLSNGNVITRLAYGLPGWVEGADLFGQVIDPVAREREVLVRATGSQDLTVLNTFAYGTHDGVVASEGATVRAFNLGTDNLGPGGHTVDADASSTVSVVNLMRFNGTTSRGPVTIVNPLAIHMATSALGVAADAAEGAAGTVRVEGNEAEPGRYETGSAVAVVAEPADGSAFAGWRDASGAVVSRDARYAFALAADTSLTATFVVAPTTDVEVEATGRCLAGRAYVAVRARNGGEDPVTVRLATPFGERTVDDVAPGKSAYQSFATRATAVEAGAAQVTVTADGGDVVLTAPYDAVRCG